jgi:hypothetical protein
MDLGCYESVIWLHAAFLGVVIFVSLSESLFEWVIVLEMRCLRMICKKMNKRTVGLFYEGQGF